METRIINLYDDDTNYLIETDAPAEEIRKAIEYKNKLLFEEDVLFRSDFEEMQEYLYQKGFCFEPIGYVNEIESYIW